MRSSLALVLSLLTATTLAAPGTEAKPKCKKAVCNADNCLRAVKATSAKPFPSSATADCSSFMRKTVTPCAATSTATTTVTVTDQASTVTVTGTVDNTQVNTVFETLAQVVTTIEDTVTFIQPTEVDVINIIVTAVTVTAAVPNKRAVETLPLPPAPTLPGHLEARSVTLLTTAAAAATGGTCAATTNAPSSVPTYASACSGTVRYSSACSCAGVTGEATTLPQATVTTTVTSTAHYTPTSTVTAVVTNNVPVTVVQTQLVPTAFETTDATVIVPSAFTVTSNVVIPTTVTVAPPVCSSYKFVVADNARAGQFIGGQTPSGGPNGVSYGFIYFTDASNAVSFHVRPDGRVYSGGDTYGWITRNNGLYYILQMTDYSESTYRVNSVLCSISNGGTSIPGAVGMLTCTTDAGTPTSLVSCANLGNNLLQAPNVAAAGNGCIAVSLAAIPSC